MLLSIQQVYTEYRNNRKPNSKNVTDTSDVKGPAQIIVGPEGEWMYRYLVHTYHTRCWMLPGSAD